VSIWELLVVHHGQQACDPGAERMADKDEPEAFCAATHSDTCAASTPPVKINMSRSTNSTASA
jgi:hypothetical protein